MQTITRHSIRLNRTIPAIRSDVFEAWTRPELIRRWSCPVGMRVTDSQVDLRVGGTYTLRMEAADGSVHTATGSYVSIEEPSLLVYTWDWLEHPVGETLVTVRFTERGTSTEVGIVHERFPDADSAKSHDEGWASCLDQLEAVFS